MAKVEGSFITKIKGSIGNTTFRQNGKNNVASQKAISVKNPCTPEQIKQRMYSRVVNSAYSTLKEICNHSFEGVKNGAESMSYFLSANQSVLKQMETDQTLFLPKGKKRVFAPNPYLISEGSLTTPEMYAGGRSDSTAGAQIGDDWGDYASVTPPTVEQLHKFLNAEIGNQITLINVDVIPYNQNLPITNVQTYKMSLTRLIFKEDAAAKKAFDNNGRLVFDNLDMKKSQIGKLILFGGKVSDDATKYSIYAAYDEETDMPNVGLMTGYILSKKGENGIWQRSTSFLQLNLSYERKLFSDESEYLYNKCYDTYTSNNTDYELNNAED